MRRLPPLNPLRAFEATARHQSVSKAAAELNVTHSAVSHQICTLEDALKVPLSIGRARASDYRRRALRCCRRSRRPSRISQRRPRA